MATASARPDWLVSLGQFGAWILTSAGAIFDALYIRSAIQSILSALSLAHGAAYQRQGGLGVDFQFTNALTATDEFLLVVLGCVALACIIAIEYYFRKGRPRGLLLKRIGRVVLIEVAVFVVAILIVMFV